MKTSASLSILAILLQMGCSSTTPPATVQLPNSLKIASIQVAGSTHSWTPANTAALPLPCSATTPILVQTNPAPDATTSTIDNFTITVPGDCGTLVSCGWFKLRVVPTEGSEIDVATAVSPITVSGITQAGFYDFALELHDASDAVFMGDDGSPFGDRVPGVEFTAPPECPTPGPGDAGA